MTNEKATGRDSDKIMLRVPDGMRDRIAASAKVNNRSMNAEIVSRLQVSFEINQSSRSSLEKSLKNVRNLSTHGVEIPTKAVEDLLRALDDSRKAVEAFAHEMLAEEPRPKTPPSSAS